MQASNYQDYILAKLAEEEEAEHNTSEIISQIDSSYMNYRHTANPKIGGQNSLSQPRISNSNSKMNHFSGRNGPKAHYEMDQVDYREEDELEDEHLDAELQHGESQRSVVLEEHTEDNEVNEAIVSAFPKKLFSKVLAVYAQTFGLFRSVVLDKLSNGIIISRKQKLSHGRI